VSAFIPGAARRIGLDDFKAGGHELLEPARVNMLEANDGVAVNGL